MLFEFSNRADRLDLQLYVGPGPADIRNCLIGIANNNKPLFAPTKKVAAKWTRIFSRSFLTADDYKQATLLDVKPRVEAKWEMFINNELREIVEAMNVESPTH